MYLLTTGLYLVTGGLYLVTGGLYMVIGGLYLMAYDMVCCVVLQYLTIITLQHRMTDTTRHPLSRCVTAHHPRDQESVGANTATRGSDGDIHVTLVCGSDKVRAVFSPDATEYNAALGQTCMRTTAYTTGVPSVPHTMWATLLDRRGSIAATSIKVSTLTNGGDTRWVVIPVREY